MKVEIIGENLMEISDVSWVGRNDISYENFKLFVLGQTPVDLTEIETLVFDNQEYQVYSDCLIGDMVEIHKDGVGFVE